MLGRAAARQTLVVIASAKDFKALANRLNLAEELSRVRRDGYLLRMVTLGGREHVVALGQTPRGAVNAVWRLIREAAVDHGSVTIDPPNLLESPYIATREAMVSEPWTGDRDSSGKLVPPPRRVLEKYC